MKISDIQFYPVNKAAFPMAIQPRVAGQRVSEWLSEHSRELVDLLIQHGAILLRGFGIQEEEFGSISRLLCDDPLEYMYRSTPRTRVSENVYTTTEYPKHQTIPQHNENSYTRDWPMRIVFYCVQPATAGGETPLARGVLVTQHIAPEILETFARRQLRYVRNYGGGVDLSWQTVFQTESREEVEEYCRRNEIHYEWKPNNGLKTFQICQAVCDHPLTRQTLWFNQAHLFHVSALDDKTRKALLSIYSEGELPRNAYYGDGAPIEPQVLEGIRKAYQATTVAFPWQAGDILLVDNMLVSHGRNPFEGKRRVLVAMGNPYSSLAQRLKLEASPAQPAAV